jgi:hypothetical protein
MVILESFTSLIVLLIFFGVLGLGVTNLKTAKNNVVLLPIFGYATLIFLSYFISANFKISGASAVGWTILILLSSFLFRIKSFSTFLQEIYKNRQGHMFLAVAAIPICTLILPALLIGFKYFFGYVNFDFFYNSQDSWYMMTHDVLQFSSRYGLANRGVIPLDWSASFSGRIGVGILGAFAAKALHADVLQFNTLLLNTIVVMFALSMSLVCKEFFKLSNKAILVAVFFSVMSASYVQAYCYYVLGQISVIPVFVVYCIYLKRFIDSITEKEIGYQENMYIFVMALLLNILIVMYAIIAFFALCLTFLSFLFILQRENTKIYLFLFLKWIAVSSIVFCFFHVLIAAQSIDILKSWVLLSNHVAAGSKTAVAGAFPEYLTEGFLALILGLCNYPSPTSVFHFFTAYTRGLLLFSLGLLALMTVFFAIRRLSNASNITKGAKAIVVSLFLLTIGLSVYFFYTQSGYGIFKLQSWFFPIIMPIYVYFITVSKNNWKEQVIKLGCLLILVLNVFASMIYLSDFFILDMKRHFTSIHGITGNKDINDLVVTLSDTGVSPISLFLNSGLESAWISEYLRLKTFDKVAHNFQMEQEKNYDANACKKNENVNWFPSGLVVVPNPNIFISSDIVDPPKAEAIQYQNTSFMLIDSTQLTSLMFVGAGAYPISFSRHNINEFPSKYRMVENGLSVFIYSKTNKVGNIAVEVTLPKESSDGSHIVIKMLAKHYFFFVKSKAVLRVPNVTLHKGLNCIAIETNPLTRSDISTDIQRKSFLISRVSFE